IDLRLPFYETRLIEFCAAMPEEEKLKNGLIRWVFRVAMEGYLPDLVRLRPRKSKYEPNFHEGLRKAESARIRHLLLEKDLGLSEFVNMDYVREVVGGFEDGSVSGG